MARPSNYSPELRARAVRMVAELTPDCPSQYAAITAVAKNLFSASGRCLQDHDSGVGHGPGGGARMTGHAIAMAWLTPGVSCHPAEVRATSL